MAALIGDPGPPVARHDGSEFGLERLVAAKNAAAARIVVCIPARDEEATIGGIVSAIRGALMSDVAFVDAILVVDDASSDATARRACDAGATVVAGPGAGKGEAMALGAATLLGWARASFPGIGDAEIIVVYLDGDVTSFEPSYVTGLVGPLLESDVVHLVKGSYRRPLGTAAEGGGRVTELVARPMLQLVFPELTSVEQPLAGETALRASLLEKLVLAPGYAVEVALLIDALRLCGTEAIAQVDLGVRRHRNRPLGELVPQARTVLATILQRAGEQ